MMIKNKNTKITTLKYFNDNQNTQQQSCYSDKNSKTYKTNDQFKLQTQTIGCSAEFRNLLKGLVSGKELLTESSSPGHTLLSARCHETRPDILRGAGRRLNCSPSSFSFSCTTLCKFPTQTF